MSLNRYESQARIPLVEGGKDIGYWPAPVDSAAGHSETHDWMVNHINELSNSLKSFVEKYYSANTQWDDVKNASDPLEPYRAVMFMGLQGTQLYLRTIANDTIRTSNFSGYIQSLTVNTKSCPLISLD